MSKHTPGPWACEIETASRSSRSRADWRVVVSDDRIICRVGGINMPQVEEDARLIAAAPEMHAILTGILEVLDHNDPWTKAARQNLASCIRPVLAKIEGGV